MIVAKIISGGQTGADRGGLKAALELGLPHGGHVPKGRLSEDGSVPLVYQLQETSDNDYRTRTRLNVDNADVTVMFTFSQNGMDGGTLFTKNYCEQVKKPYAHVSFGVLYSPEGDTERVKWLREKLTGQREKLGRDIVINVAGNRESKAPGLEARVERFLCVVLSGDELPEGSESQ